MTGFWLEIADGVFSHTFEPFGVNSYSVVGANGVLVIDSGNSVPQGQQLLDESLALSHQANAGGVVGLVNTHAHYDHCFGNMPFRAAGIPIYAHERAGEHFKSHAQRALDAYSRGHFLPGITAGLWSDVATFTPTKSISMPRPSTITALRDFGRTINFQTLPPAHTTADLLLHLQEDDIWIVGDIIEQGADPSVESDSDVGQWITVLEDLMNSSSDSTVFLPGHGSPSTFDTVNENIKLLRMNL